MTSGQLRPSATKYFTFFNIIGYSRHWYIKIKRIEAFKLLEKYLNKNNVNIGHNQ